jgi:hypothetical protein
MGFELILELAFESALVSSVFTRSFDEKYMSSVSVCWLKAAVAAIIVTAINNPDLLFIYFEKVYVPPPINVNPLSRDVQIYN